MIVLRPPALAEEKSEAADRSHGELVSRDEWVWDGVEGEAELVEHSQWDGYDDFGSGELEEFSAVAGEDLGATAPPLNSFDRAGELDAPTCFADFSGEELRQAIIAFANAEDVFAMDFFLRVLLDGEGMDADLAIVGCIEALNVVDDLFTLLRRELFERRVVGQGEIGAFPFFELAQEFEDSALIVTLLKFIVLLAVICAVESVGMKAGFADEVPELGWMAVNEFGPKFKDLIVFPEGADSATDPVPCL